MGAGPGSGEVDRVSTKCDVQCFGVDGDPEVLFAARRAEVSPLLRNVSLLGRKKWALSLLSAQPFQNVVRAPVWGKDRIKDLFNRSVRYDQCQAPIEFHPGHPKRG